MLSTDKYEKSVSDWFCVFSKHYIVRWVLTSTLKRSETGIRLFWRRYSKEIEKDVEMQRSERKKNGRL